MDSTRIVRIYLLYATIPLIFLVPSCGGSDMDHKVDGTVETQHAITVDLEMCKEADGNYRAQCVDDFIAAWKAQKDCGQERE